MDLGQLGSFWGVIPIYTAALLLYAVWFRGGEDAQGRWASTLLWFAVVVHAFGLAALGIGRGFWPPTNLGETLSLVSLSTAVLYLYLEIHGRERGLAPFAVAVVVGILVGASLIGPSFLVSPILREPLFPPHASAIILAMAGFVMGAVLSVAYLLQYRQLRQKRSGLLMQRLPSLQGLDQMQRRATRVGWIFLTLAIVFGSLLWHEVNGHYWEWDPTQCMSLLTWILYGAALLLRRMRGWHGDRLARANLVVFAIVTVGMLLVNFVFYSAHRFGGRRVICLLGQNHKTAPVELREKIAVTEEKRDALIELLRHDPVLSESVVLSTCNRMELYAVSSTVGAEEGRARLSAVVSKLHGIPESEWGATAYYSQEDVAIRHLFRVASGLDSMVLGEGQILAQVKDAEEFARSHGLVHEILGRAFNEAIRCGKSVRTDTAISEGAVSVAAASVSLARKIFDDLAEESVLLVGAGDTGARVARHLQIFGVRDLRVTNRTRSRADALAAELNASVVPFDQLDEHLGQVSIAITTVHSAEPLLTADRVRRAIDRMRTAPLFLVDLAVPRNVDPAVESVAGVFVYDVDDLQGIVLGDEERRRAEAAKAEDMVEGRLDEFVEWYRMRAAVPALNDLRQHFEALRQAELDAVRNRGGEEAEVELVDKVTRRLMNKLLHEPTVELKRRVASDGPDAHLKGFRELFGLDAPGEDE